jgi:MFS family permease
VTINAQPRRKKKSSGLYYGWVVLGIAYLIMFFTAGVSQAFGVFIKPMTDEFGWDRSTLSLAVSIFAIMSAVVPPVAGRIADRFGPRVVLTIGVALNASGMMLMALTPNIAYVYVVYGVIIGTGFGFSGHAAMTALISRWFDRRRGFALSIASTGLGTGQLVLAPLATFIVITASWQAAFFVTGFMSAMLIPICFLMLRRPTPEEPSDAVATTQDPAVEETQPVDCLTNEAIRERMNQAWSSRSFWMIASGFMACGFTIYFLMVHMVALATDRGISPGQAGTALGIVGGMGIISNLIVGALSDKIGRKYLLVGLYFTRAIAVVILLGATSATHVYIFAALFGLSRANGVLVSASIIDQWGRRAVGSIVGYLTMFHQLFAAAGAFFGGLVYDLTGSYDIMLYISITALVSGTIASFFIAEPRRQRRVKTPVPLPA